MFRFLHFQTIFAVPLVKLDVMNMADARFEPTTMVSSGVGNFRSEKFMEMGRRELPKYEGAWGR
jgi:hypothetical protein